LFIAMFSKGLIWYCFIVEKCCRHLFFLPAKKAAYDRWEVVNR
jgi:hypothetical protein